MARFSYPLFFFISHLPLLSLAQDERSFDQRCQNFHCGNLGYIGFPFSNWTHPECGLMAVDDCNEPVQKIQLGKEGPWYNITNISENNTITLEDQVFQKYLENRSCESFKNFTFPPSPLLSFEIISNLTLFKCPPNLHTSSTNFSFYCKDSLIFYNFTHIRIGEKGLPSLPPRCSIIQLPANNKTQNTTDLFNLFTGVFSLQVHVPLDCFKCHSRGGQCQLDRKGNFFCCQTTECYDCDGRGGTCLSHGNKTKTGNKNKKLKLGLGIGASSAGICILIILAHCFRKKLCSANSIIFWRQTAENYQNIEAFLRDCGSLAPKRYTYSDIKKMTNSFKHKLGQGGYGGVYKGFCFEGYRRALIYEFLPNGSLEKFICEKNTLETNQILNWETLYKIAVGIARGLEYLHRGCSTRILHFDIKPHNILLDEDFCPKISDFGLAKICPRKESVVSMTGARGTVGYIAPEVFCRNFGAVSHKSDVYSYGMMVFEMTGRKNNGVGNNRSSDVYFPDWVYECLETDELVLQGIENEEDKKYARTMVIVSLWCIQTLPSNRPTISRVVEMLEGGLEFLQIPPKPFLSSPGVSQADSSIGQYANIVIP
ncbi:Receptor-like protein kinase [Melia azedarach]|uniref:Receptor-like protein kinase n=1 Tax=Melia azedarach TaxID=155640 RepID=A0ACC1XEQ8_MELAZ|nr:Receptor-like protein kinase [Melia azedarach]